MSYQNKSIEGNSSSMFEFFCIKYQNGQYCESKIKICQNETCSGNGLCEDENNQNDVKIRISVLACIQAKNVKQTQMSLK